MIKELIKLSTHLDNKGLRKEADYLDAIIKKIARPSAERGANLEKYYVPRILEMGYAESTIPIPDGTYKTKGNSAEILVSTTDEQPTGYLLLPWDGPRSSFDGEITVSSGKITWTKKDPSGFVGEIYKVFSRQ